MGRRRKKDGGYEFLRFISLLGLYILLSPSKNHSARAVKREEPVIVNNIAPNQQSGVSGNSGGDAKLGCGIIAFVLLILAILAESKGLVFFIIFVVVIVAFMNNESDSSGGNASQSSQQFAANNGNEQYAAQGNAQYGGNEQNVYTRRSAEPFVPNLTTHVFVPDEWTADLLKEVSLSERLRYLNVDSVGELIEKFPTCTDDDDLIDFRYGEKSVVGAKRKAVADKYRYMPADFNPNLVVPVAAVAAMAAPAAAAYYYDDDSDDNDEVSFWGNNNAQAQAPQQKPAWQDPYAYHGTEKYDEFYNLREDEYREEYGEDFEDAIDDEYEDTYINK